MGKSANCIRMLLLLKARGFLTKEELAQLLETNIRNISEYRKELEEARKENLFLKKAAAFFAKEID